MLRWRDWGDGWRGGGREQERVRGRVGEGRQDSRVYHISKKYQGSLK